mmetsp:Transcript_25983/g.85448  ORF Transcript_25983/g.85448 Transcript_25983/m.85448 type:complete len:425 (+) Transcript_25983:1055-2329(+)
MDARLVMRLHLVPKPSGDPQSVVDDTVVAEYIHVVGAPRPALDRAPPPFLVHVLAEHNLDARGVEPRNASRPPVGAKVTHRHERDRPVAVAELHPELNPAHRVVDRHVHAHLRRPSAAAATAAAIVALAARAVPAVVAALVVDGVVVRALGGFADAVEAKELEVGRVRERRVKGAGRDCRRGGWRRGSAVQIAQLLKPRLLAASVAVATMRRRRHRRPSCDGALEKLRPEPVEEEPQRLVGGEVGRRLARPRVRAPLEVEHVALRVARAHDGVAVGEKRVVGRVRLVTPHLVSAEREHGKERAPRAHEVRSRGCRDEKVVGDVRKERSEEGGVAHVAGDERGERLGQPEHRPRNLDVAVHVLVDPPFGVAALGVLDPREEVAEHLVAIGVRHHDELALVDAEHRFGVRLEPRKVAVPLLEEMRR